MRILISGSTGVIGRDLVPALRLAGHSVVRLTRHPVPHNPTEIGWDPAQGQLDQSHVEGFDAVINLAGETLDGRWTEEKKQQIRDSRVKSTQLLSKAIVGLPSPPHTLISASGVGIYGERGDEVVDESSSAGNGFLADLCIDWEAATNPARDTGVRVLPIRPGIVLSNRGGALPKMLTPFKFGVGGPFGNGQQYWSWIAIEDFVGAILHLLENRDVSGPVNFVSPEPLPNAEFARTMGQVVKRPAILPLPAPVARLVLGEFADEALLASTRVQPKVLLDSGYQFRFPDLQSALRHLLNS